MTTDEQTRLTRYLMRASGELRAIAIGETSDKHKLSTETSFPAAAAFAVASILAKVPATQNYLIGQLAKVSVPIQLLEMVVKATRAFVLPEQPVYKEPTTLKLDAQRDQQRGEKCQCADALNFGEPQPDCSRCGGSGTVRDPDRSTGPIFNP